MLRPSFAALVRRNTYTSDAGDVELALSSSFADESYDARLQHSATVEGGVTTSKRFEFLESAPIHALVPHLAREHAQTIAVVLSHLRAAASGRVLAALPQKVQAETVERLSTLGDTDPECVSVVDARAGGLGCTARRFAREQRTPPRYDGRDSGRRRCEVTRSNPEQHERPQSGAVANQFSPRQPERATTTKRQLLKPAHQESGRTHCAMTSGSTNRPPATVPRAEPRFPRIAFDDLAELDSRTLVCRAAASRCECARARLSGLARRPGRPNLRPDAEAHGARFRRELRRLGPTRLSDVEAAQRAVAQIAARQLAEQRHSTRDVARLINTRSELDQHMATIIRKDSPRETPSGRAVQPVAFSFSDMRGQANDYLGTVRTEAAKIVQQAHQQAEQIRRQAEVAGRKAAEAAIERVLDEQVGKRMETLLPALETLLAEMNDTKGELLSRWEQSALKVATAIAERIIRREIAHDPQITLDLIAETLRLAAGMTEISCTSARRITKTWERKSLDWRRRLANLRRARSWPTPNVSPGGCCVKTKFGEIDQQIESQLRRIEEELDVSICTT